MFWDTLGQAHLKLNNKKDAAAAFKKALKLEPTYEASQKGLKETGEK
jgi:cytochrome c-type biogenesis protein CcmH/NrfG